MEQEIVKQPNKNNKIILIVLGILVVLCLVCGIIGFIALRSGVNFLGNEMINEDQAEVQQIAEGIMDYDLPTGYQEQMSINLLGMGDMVLLANSTGSSVIAFLQMDSNIPIDADQVRQQMMSSMESSSSTNYEKVDEWETTIRGQQVSVLEFEGSSEDGVPMRQLTTVFDGESGSVFLMVVGEQADWNQAEIDDFFASIR